MKYNNTLHSAISTTPDEVFHASRGETAFENSKLGRYAKKFKSKKIEIPKFHLQEKVIVAQTSNLKSNQKAQSRRFLMEGTILEKCEMTRI